MNHEKIRRKAQNEVHETAIELADIGGWRSLTREEGDNELGKTWASMAVIWFSKWEELGNVENAIEEIRDMGYTVSVTEKKGKIGIEVKITSEIFERLREDS